MSRISRRHFLKSSVLAGAAGVVAGSGVHAAENNTLKVGLIGCGGRGRGAAVNALKADPNCKIVAIGDAFRENAISAAEGLQSEFEDRVELTEDTIFDGIECYKQIIPLCDVVLLCETPHFRHRSLRAAVEAGKHVFCEKPVAVDAAGIRSVMESAKIAKEKNLNLVSGLCWRYDLNVQDMMNRVRDGAIGDILSARLTYCVGKLWTRPRREDDTEMQFQVRNWYNFSWLSGDYNVEQHVHTLDKALWAMNDEPPIAAFGLGGRMQRTEQPDYGDIYDEMAVVFEYPNGRTVYSYCRQQAGCAWNENDAYFAGTKGFAQILGNSHISDLNGNIVYKQEKVASDMYTLEHIALFNAIRNGDAINNGDYMAKSTMMGILGREACYTGSRITWDEALNAESSMAPTGYTWESDPPTLPDENGRYKIPVAGLGKVYHSVVR
ncbi:MAG: Gfo/Idh/MocA family oxidoreductase [Thermoguttaceae bacterium]|nr:Gfo/Idh/MocA family oxidoreductase [Thermoguttaceae bacterium]